MRCFIVILTFLLTSCTEPTHEHVETPMVLESDTPLAGEYSIYQVESTWINQTGAEVTLEALAGRIQIVAMTYTSCEMSCPRIVAAMKDIERQAGGKVGLVLISIDPERDSPPTLAAYSEKMGLEESAWNLLTGAPDDILEIAALLGVGYQKMPDGEFAHSNIITILNEEGVIVHQQNGIAVDLTAESVRAVQELLENAK
ncbi:MAG: SCO family protein [Bacteroidetes bacterium]|nr:SCO family protein [Bacteroidota bacterium]